MANERASTPRVFINGANSAPPAALNMQHPPDSQGVLMRAYEAQNEELKQTFPTKIVIAHGVFLAILGIVFAILQFLLIGNDAYLARVSGGIWSGKWPL